MKIRIGVIHEKMKFDARRSNSKKLNEHIKRLVEEHDVNVIVLPPYSFYGPLPLYGEAKAKRVAWSNAERISVGSSRFKQGNITSLLTKWSFEYNVYLIGGPILERAGPRIYLTAVVTSPRGTVIGKYRKVNLNSAEEEIGISSGRSAGIVRLDTHDLVIGLFLDEDITMPELFKLARLSEANIIIGMMMPHGFSSLPTVRDNNNVLCYRRDVLFSLATTRSIETGLPVVVAGGAIEIENEGELIVSHTIPVEPEAGVIESRVKYIDELGTPLIIEVDTVSSRPKLVGFQDLILSKEICRCVDKLAENLIEQENKSGRGSSLGKEREKEDEEENYESEL